MRKDRQLPSATGTILTSRLDVSIDRRTADSEVGVLSLSFPPTALRYDDPLVCNLCSPGVEMPLVSYGAIVAEGPQGRRLLVLVDSASDPHDVHLAAHAALRCADGSRCSQVESASLADLPTRAAFNLLAVSAASWAGERTSRLVPPGCGAGTGSLLWWRPEMRHRKRSAACTQSAEVERTERGQAAEIFAYEISMDASGSAYPRIKTFTNVDAASPAEVAYRRGMDADSYPKYSIVGGRVVRLLTRDQIEAAERAAGVFINRKRRSRLSRKNEANYVELAAAASQIPTKSLVLSQVMSFLRECFGGFATFRFREIPRDLFLEPSEVARRQSGTLPPTFISGSVAVGTADDGDAETDQLAADLGLALSEAGVRVTGDSAAAMAGYRVVVCHDGIHYARAKTEDPYASTRGDAVTQHVCVEGAGRAISRYAKRLSTPCANPGEKRAPAPPAAPRKLLVELGVKRAALDGETPFDDFDPWRLFAVPILFDGGDGNRVLSGFDILDTPGGGALSYRRVSVDGLFDGEETISLSCAHETARSRAARDIELLARADDGTLVAISDSGSVTLPEQPVELARQAAARKSARRGKDGDFLLYESSLGISASLLEDGFLYYVGAQGNLRQSIPHAPHLRRVDVLDGSRDTALSLLGQLFTPACRLSTCSVYPAALKYLREAAKLAGNVCGAPEIAQEESRCGESGQPDLVVIEDGLAVSGDGQLMLFY